MLVVKGLSKAYPPAVTALDGVSFSLEPHTFTAVLGPSGAGKTTLLRCVLRLVRPTSGSVYFDGHDMTSCPAGELRAARASVSLIGQQFHLVRRRTALANCLAGRLRELPLWRVALGLYPRPLLVEALAALERVRLLDQAFRRADRLSGGQQQRVAVARALTQRARLLLADEPVASLDPENAHLVLDLMRGLCREQRLTVLCNLHQVELARRFADRILGLRAGKLVFDGPPGGLTSADIDRIYGNNSPTDSDGHSNECTNDR
jgi:phosphonate transport system ATP-binding protein